MTGIYENYSSLFEGELDEAQKHSVSRFRTEAMLKVAEGDTEWVEEWVTKLSQCILDPEVIENYWAVMDNASCIHGGEIEKIASKSSYRVMDYVNMAVGAAGLLGSIAPLVMDHNRKSEARNKARKTYEGVLNSNPHLRNDPNTKNYFNTVNNFAPHVASDPILLGNVLNDMQAMGPAAMTVERVQNMVGMQKDLHSMQSKGGNIPAEPILDSAKRLAEGAVGPQMRRSAIVDKAHDRIRTEAAETQARQSLGLK